MRSIIIPICVIMCVLLSTCNKNEENIQVPLPNDVISVEYSVSNLARTTKILIHSESIRFQHTNAMKTPRFMIDTNLRATVAFLQSTLNSLPSLDELWSMSDVSNADPRIDDGTDHYIIIKGFERLKSDAILTNRAIISKTLRFKHMDELPNTFRTFGFKMDSIINAHSQMQ